MEQRIIRAIAAQLSGENPSFDAQLLLAHITGHNRAWILSHPEIVLSAEQEISLKSAILKLQQRLPLPYVLGHWEFYGLDFFITPDVLIPRPETELLVEWALAHIRAYPQESFQFLDVGTGSGIIPITLAVHAPHAMLVATDISPAALEIAKTNAERHGVADRISFIQADLVPNKMPPSRFDVISANLPYIPSETLKTLDVFGKEPTIALDGGADGLDLIRSLLPDLVSLRAAGGAILLEIESRQGEIVKELARLSFSQADLQIKKDLAGHDRLLVITG